MAYREGDPIHTHKCQECEREIKITEDDATFPYPPTTWHFDPDAGSKGECVCPECLIRNNP